MGSRHKARICCTQLRALQTLRSCNYRLSRLYSRGWCHRCKSEDPARPRIIDITILYILLNISSPALGVWGHRARNSTQSRQLLHIYGPDKHTWICPDTASSDTPDSIQVCSNSKHTCAPQCTNAFILSHVLGLFMCTWNCTLTCRKHEDNT